MTRTSALRRAIGAALTVALLAPAGLAAQTAEPLRFGAGTNTASANGVLKGPNEAARDYLVQASAGSTLDVSLRTASPGTFFSVLHPYGDTVYTNQGDQRTSWNGRLIDNGAYRIRVFLDPTLASQGRGANYTLNVKLEPAR
jgi:hypothetical protein